MLVDLRTPCLVDRRWDSEGTCVAWRCLVSINQFISRHSTEARATVRLCRIKEKCLKTDLKCVNGWSSSTVQWKRVPKSRSSNRETTSSSVQVVRPNWQKLLCGWSQQTRQTVWVDKIRCSGVARRPCNCRVSRLIWPTYNWKRIFCTEPYRSVFNHCDVISVLIYRIRWKTYIRTIMPFGVIQGHWFRYQSIAHNYVTSYYWLILRYYLVPFRSYRR